MRRGQLTMISCRLSSAGRRYPPLGPMYLKAALAKAGRDVSLVDLQTHPEAHLFNVPLLVELIDAAPSDVVALSLFSDALPLVLASIRIFERHFGHRTFVLGGPGVNGSELHILRDFPEVHAVVRLSRCPGMAVPMC